MPHLEPTYLRYIYDGLVKGSIHPENAAELPEGLIGLYEEAFDERTSVVERQKLLQRFAIWALLKKEVSAAFVAEVLGDTEDEIQDFISKYSAWFNSPESGKYQLYHERLKVYLLQKLKGDEALNFNSKIIGILKNRLFDKNFSEFATYGLQFLGDHLYIEIFQKKTFKNFISSCVRKDFYERQYEVSNAFVWSKSPIIRALQLATYFKDSDAIFELSKSLVYLSNKEKESLSQIHVLLDQDKEEIVLTRLNSILDGTKDKYITSYIFHLLSILYLVSTRNKESKVQTIRRFVENIETNFTEDQGIINQSLLFPERLTIQLMVNLTELYIDPTFIFKRCSSIDFNQNNLKGFNLKQLKLLYKVVLKFFPDKEINLLVCASKSLISQKNKADFFIKKIEIVLERSRNFVEESLLYNTTYDYSLIDLIPESILEKTANRRVINFCCENYLNLGTNKLPNICYQAFFEIEKIENVDELLPLPNIELTKILDVSSLVLLSEKLSAHYKSNNDDTVQTNKRCQEKIISCLVNQGFVLSSFEKIIKQYQFEKNLLFYLEVLNPNKTIEIDWQKIKKLDAPSISDSNIDWIEKAISTIQDSTRNSWHIEFELILAINLFLKAKIKVPLFNQELYDQIYDGLKKIEKIDYKSNRNFETFYIFQYLVFKCFDLESILRLINDSKFKGTRHDIYRFLICYYLSIADFKNAWSIVSFKNTLEDQSKGSPINQIFNDLLLVSDLSFQIGDEHFEFIINFLKLKKLDSDRERFSEFKLMVDLLSKSIELSSAMIGKIHEIVKNKFSGFNNYTWKILASKYYTERIDIDIMQLFNHYHSQSTNFNKINSDELNAFRMNSELLRFELLNSKFIKKKVAIHCLKNGMKDYFLSNNLHKENLFSESELISYSTLQMNLDNIGIFVSLIHAFKDEYNQLAFKNELHYFLCKNSLDTSVIKLKSNEERKSHEIIISAITSLKSPKNSTHKLFACIHELNNIEDDELDFETGEVFDGNEEKVKSLYFIISNLWKIDKKKLANEYLREAFKYCLKMEYDTEKLIWHRKLEYLAVLILDENDFESLINSKLHKKERISAEMIDRIFKENISSLISKILDSNHLDRSLMRLLVASYLKYNTIEDVFLFSNQFRIHSNKISWRNQLLEELYIVGQDFNGKVSFENYFIVYNSSGSMKVLEQMLKYEFLKEINSTKDKEILYSKYSDFLTKGEIQTIMNNYHA